MTTHPSSRQAGFTLVEISIVLVIIGLLTGGVMAGTYLVQAAKTRAVISEVGEFKTALALFNDKYAEWPGDLSNATALWPDDGTADGDGDGQISHPEGFRAWQHLALAEMIPGRYDGIANTPTSKMETGQYGIEYANGAATGGISWSYGLTGNAIIFYQRGTTPTQGSEYTGGMTPMDASTIDSALDDSLPLTGTIRAVNNGTTQCTLTATTTKGGAYNTASAAPLCSLIFKFAD